jgi:hypothetical protein
LRIVLKGWQLFVAQPLRRELRRATRQRRKADAEPKESCIIAALLRLFNLRNFLSASCAPAIVVSHRYGSEGLANELICSVLRHEHLAGFAAHECELADNLWKSFVEQSGRVGAIVKIGFTPKASFDVFKPKYFRSAHL